MQDEKTLSRVMIMRNMLVAILREQGLFTPGNLMADDKPGLFLPLAQYQYDGRKRKVQSSMNV